MQQASHYYMQLMQCRSMLSFAIAGLIPQQNYTATRQCTVVAPKIWWTRIPYHCYYRG